MQSLSVSAGDYLFPSLLFSEPDARVSIMKSQGKKNPDTSLWPLDVRAPNKLFTGHIFFPFKNDHDFTESQGRNRILLKWWGRLVTVWLFPACPLVPTAGELSGFSLLLFLPSLPASKEGKASPREIALRGHISQQRVGKKKGGWRPFGEERYGRICAL